MASIIKENRLTEGPILQRLILFALPMMAGNMLQQIYNIADTLIVGRFIGSDALAAVGSAYTLMIFINSVIIGLCMGSGAIISKDYGAKDNEMFKKDVFHSFVFILMVTIAIYCIIYSKMNAIIGFMHIPEELILLSKEYISVVFAGVVFVFFYNFFAYVLRAMGDSFSPLIFLAGSSILNVFLDILFVIDFSGGVYGAALATVISQCLSGLGILIYSMIRHPFLRPYQIFVGFDGRRMAYIIKTDLFTGLQQSVMNFGILMIQGLVNSFGVVIMAAFAAAVKIDTLAYMPAQEFANAYSLFISQNYGAGEKERIKNGTKLSFITSIIFCLVISILVFVFGGIFMRFFVDYRETAIILAGRKYLRIEGAAYIGIGILFLWYGYFRAVDRPQISLILTIVSLGTRVILSYALAPNTSLGVIAIWLSIPIGWFLADVTGLIVYNSGHKK